MEDVKSLFKRVVSDKSDDELVLMITEHRKYYKPELVHIAEKEFIKRDIPEYRIETLNEEFREMEVRLFPKTEEPLENHLKFMAFILPGLMMLMLSERYCLGGYRRKYKELTKFTIYGFCFYMSFFVLGDLLRLMF